MTEDVVGAPGDGVAGALGRDVASGVAWTGMSVAASRAAVFAGQLALGALLTRSEFGLYALAISISSLVTSMQDGGIRDLIVQKGADEYVRIRAPAFWLAAAINGALGLVLVAIARPAASTFGHDEVAPLLFVLGGSVVLNTPYTILMAKLRVDMRFKAFAAVTTFDAVGRVAGAVLFAIAGFGSLSFVLPLPLVYLAEWAILRRLTGERLLRMRPSIREWPELLRPVKWLVIAGLGTAALGAGDYLILGSLIPVAALGVYFFAFQLLAQSTTVISSSLLTVLLPTLSTMSGQVVRRKAAVLRTARSLMIVVSPLSMGLAVIFAPLEEVLWSGKWSAAVGAFIALALSLPIRLTFPVARANAMAAGRFAMVSGLVFAYAGGLVATAGVTGWLSQSPTTIARAVGSYFVAIGPLIFWIAIRDAAISLAELLKVIIPPWLVSVTACAAVLIADVAWFAGMVSPVRVLVLGSAFTALVVALSRQFLSAGIRDLATTLPGRLPGMVLGALAKPTRVPQGRS
jgi:lipopolysaccharide exporter